MRKYTRGEFLSLSAMLAGGVTLATMPFKRLSALSSRPWASAETPDLILVNGRVLTQDTALPSAQAFAVNYGRFVAVGSNSDVRNLATRDTPIIDAGGMTVLPGFID